MVLGKQGGISGAFQTNVAADLQVDPQKNPKFMMVTGFANLRRGGTRLQWSNGICYVAEVTTGQGGRLRRAVVAHDVPVGPAADGVAEASSGSAPSAQASARESPPPPASGTDSTTGWDEVRVPP